MPLIIAGALGVLLGVLWAVLEIRLRHAAKMLSEWSAKDERKARLLRQIIALESQGKYCPPEALAKLRREFESLK